jgi:hypothetical protein
MCMELKTLRMYKVKVKFSFTTNIRGETRNESWLRSPIGRDHFASLVADLLEDIKRTAGKCSFSMILKTL